MSQSPLKVSAKDESTPILVTNETLNKKIDTMNSLMIGLKKQRDEALSKLNDIQLKTGDNHIQTATSPLCTPDATAARDDICSAELLAPYIEREAALTASLATANASLSAMEASLAESQTSLATKVAEITTTLTAKEEELRASFLAREERLIGTKTANEEALKAAEDKNRQLSDKLHASNTQILKLEESLESIQNRVEDLQSQLCTSETLLLKATDRADAITDSLESQTLSFADAKKKSDSKIEKLVAAVDELVKEKETLDLDNDRLRVTIESLKSENEILQTKSATAENLASRFQEGSREASLDLETEKRKSSKIASELDSANSKISSSLSLIDNYKSEILSLKVQISDSAAENEKQKTMAANSLQNATKRSKQFETDLVHMTNKEKAACAETELLVQQLDSAIDKITVLEKSQSRYELALSEEISRSKTIDVKLKSSEMKEKDRRLNLELKKTEYKEMKQVIQSLEEERKSALGRLEKLESERNGKLMAVAGAVGFAVMAVCHSTRMFC
jgi:chromosome segregation ATPase